MKKVIAYLMILATFNLVGCYTREQFMLPSDYKFDENADLIVTTKDTSISIKKGDYKLKDDTLIYKSSDHVKNITLKKEVKLPTNKIEKLEVKKMDTTFSCLLGGTVIIAICVAIFLLTFKLQFKGNWLKF
jgi:hypothetical protein